MSFRIYFIYALVTENDPNTYLYIGRSDDCRRRLRDHIKESEYGTSNKCETLRELIEDGETITYTILESGIRPDEDQWITNMRADGHPLTNGKQGDHDYLIFDRPEGSGPTPWTPELFDVQWDNSVPGTKKTEKSVFIKGVGFYKRAKQQLRMAHPKYGHWKFEGSCWEKIIEDACQTLTKGTDEHQFMIDQQERAERFKGY